MKNCCSVEMESEIPIVKPIEFEPVTLAHGNEKMEAMIADVKI